MMRAHVFSPFNERRCIEEVTRAFPLAEIESKGGQLILTEGRYQIRLALEEWGPLDEIKSEVSISPTKLHEAEETSGESLPNVGDERLDEMVCLAINTLQPIENWRDDRDVSIS